MTYAICIVPVAPIRLRGDHREEMVSQVLFGESLLVRDFDKDGWMHIEACADGYTGFCRANQFVITEDATTDLKHYSAEWVQEIFVNKQRLMIPYGSNLSLLKDALPGYTLTYNGSIHNAAEHRISADSLQQISSVFLNTAYLWGGRSVFGIDCSGFVQAVFKMFNIRLERDANQQVNAGEAVGFLQEVQCGDLAFFDDENGDIIHVGIMLNSQQIIHSSGIVRIDAIDSEGIINGTTKKRSHRLRIIKRII
ncbi:MAG: NlpC/P60 family protein [Chitinophagaceae bacterium]|nr:MAG: NlpC/P60 family protein [Chitinophagaceae bacterium]